MGVTVIADSAAALPPDAARDHGVVVVPAWVMVGGERYRDGALSQSELLERRDEALSTSGPTPGDFAEALEQAGSDGALVLTVSSDLSSTYRSARLAARAFGGRARVVDTRNMAAAQALVVLAAAEAATTGASLDEVEGAALAAIPQVRLVAALDTLDFIVESGRVPGVAGWVGKTVGMKPLIEVRDGKIRPLPPAFSRPAALARILERWRRSRQADRALHVAALHALDADAAGSLLDDVTAECQPVTAFVAEFSAAMVVHAGPGIVGLAWRWETR